MPTAPGLLTAWQWLGAGPLAAVTDGQAGCAGDPLTAPGQLAFGLVDLNGAPVATNLALLPVGARVAFARGGGPDVLAFVLTSPMTIGATNAVADVTFAGGTDPGAGVFVTCVLPAAGVAPVPPLVTWDMLRALASAVASGVTDVKYADREVKYASLADLLKAYQWAWVQYYGVGQRRRTLACFSKGLPPASSGFPCGPEHGEAAVPIPSYNYRDPDLRRPAPVDGVRPVIPSPLNPRGIP